MTWIIAYKVSERGGIGEGGTGRVAVYTPAGHFQSRAAADKWLTENPKALSYIANDKPFVEVLKEGR